MTTKLIVVNSPPQAQGRPRFSLKGQFPRAFNPHKEKKSWTKLQVSQQFNEVLECPIEVVMTFYMKIPASTSKKKQLLMQSNEIKHIKKPDIDNLQAYILNCLTDIVYRDDRQVYKITASKQYDACPRTEIIVKWDSLEQQEKEEK